MNSYLERLQQELDSTMGGASPATLSQASSGKWSAIQIAEHLLLTYKHTGRGLAKCLQQGAPLASRPTLHNRFASLLVLKLGYLPNGRKSPERAIPQGMLADEVLAGIGEELRKMDSILTECERQFGGRKNIIDHPFIGPLTVDGWRKFHWIHGQHHLRQMRERIGKA
jgi:Protein of unknown function (DUF1569)